MSISQWAAIAAWCVWIGAIAGVVGLVAFYKMRAA
jgi:hypothetical protein